MSGRWSVPLAPLLVLGLPGSRRTWWGGLLAWPAFPWPVYEFARAAVTRPTDWKHLTTDINFLVVLEIVSLRSEVSRVCPC